MTAPDPRRGEIEARAVRSRTWALRNIADVDRDYLLAELRAARSVLAERDAELLNLKGPCRAPGCRLHHAHRGPCAAVTAAKGDGDG